MEVLSARRVKAMFLIMQEGVRINAHSIRDSEHFVYSKMREDILHIVRWCGDL